MSLLPFVNEEKHTPFMRQYLAIKEQHPTELVFIRLGDFYELFFDDAVKASSLLDLTLTSRSEAEGRYVPMAGVPQHTLDQYLVKLVGMGHSVVICDQVGEVGKGLMERAITRIVTPGTLIDHLGDRQVSLLLALYPSPAKEPQHFVYGAAWLDLAAGHLQVTQIPVEQLANQLARLNPAEILIPEGTTLPDESKWVVRQRPSWHFDGQKAERDLSRHFGMQDLATFEIAPLALAALAALWQFAHDTQRRHLSHITTIVRENAQDFIMMDSITRRNLEISETLRPTPGPTLLSLLDTCATGMGSRWLRHALHNPLRNQTQVQERHLAVDEMLGTKLWSSLQEQLKGCGDVERIATRLALRSARPKELARLREALAAIPSLVSLLAQAQTPLLQHLRQKLQIAPDCHALLASALLPDPATSVRDGPVFADGHHPELAQLRHAKSNYGEALLAIETRERERSNLSTLKVEYNKVHGFFIEVSKGQAARVPEDYQRRQTLKNSERFTTTDLKDLEYRVLHANEQALTLERQLYDQFLEQLQPYLPVLRDLAQSLAALDGLSAFARAAARYRYCQPVLTSEPLLSIEGGRHPVVEGQVDNFIANDALLNDEQRLMILTGPNMGGKSTYMRQNALIVLMAYCGAFVPADAARLGPIDAIFTRIGAADDLSSGRSTFMVEMSEAAAILRQAGPNSLVLMDEIGRGTSALEGMALAIAIAHRLLNHNRSLTLFATHYFEVTQLATESDGCVNFHVRAALHDDKIVFLYDIKEGPANQSYALEVATLAGIPAPVVSEASRQLQKLNAHPKVAEDLFSPNALPHPVVSALARIAPDELTPKEALAYIYQLKKLLGTEGTKG